MPEFHALQCFSCDQFQVCQARKDSKFTCKLCGARQSVRRVYARADAARPVREHVQRLNLTRGLAEEAYEDGIRENDYQRQPHNLEPEHPDLSPNTPSRSVASKKGAHTGKSRWEHHVLQAASKFSEAADVEAGSAQEDGRGIEFVTALPDAPNKSRGTSRKRCVSSQPISDQRFAFRKGQKAPVDPRHKMSSEDIGRENAPVDCNYDELSPTAGKKARISNRHERIERPQAAARKFQAAGEITLVAPGSDEIFEDEVCF